MAFLPFFFLAAIISSIFFGIFIGISGALSPFLPGFFAGYVSSTAATIDPAALDENAAPVRAGRTELEIALEREESIAANQVRMQRELTEMRAKFDALQKELEETIRAQRAAVGEARRPSPIRPITEGEE